jgi:hypothetical protein
MGVQALGCKWCIFAASREHCIAYIAFLIASEKRTERTERGRRIGRGKQEDSKGQRGQKEDSKRTARG